MNTGTHLSVLRKRANLFAWTENKSLGYENDVSHTVIVWDRAGGTLKGRVYAVLCDVLIELPVTGVNEAHRATMCKAPYR